MDPLEEPSGALQRSSKFPQLLSDTAWNGYLKNLGLWIGKRALANNRGKVLVDLPCRITVRRYRTSDNEDFVSWQTAIKTADAIDETEEEWSKQELATFGSVAADGSFSLGVDVFVGEQMTIEQCLFDDRFRIRTTFAFDWEGCLSGIVASRDRLVSENEPLSEKNLNMGFVEPAAWRNPRVFFDYMLGLWEGTGVSMNATSGEFYHLTSRLRFGQRADGRITESSVLRVADGGPSRIFEASGKMDGNMILYPEANVQVYLLPGGVHVASPIRIRRGRPFTLESAFLMRPDRRKRVLRLYNRDCEWVNTVFVNERRVVNVSS